MTLLTKLGIGVLGLGTSSTVGYGIYELSRSKTISEILSRSWTVLKFSTEDTTDNTNWDNLVKKHRTDLSQTPSIPKISGLTFTVSEDTVTFDDRNKLKRECEKLLKKIYSEEVKNDYTNAENWCTDKHLKTGKLIIG